MDTEAVTDNDDRSGCDTMVTVDRYRDGDLAGLCGLMEQWRDDHLFTMRVTGETVSEILGDPAHAILVARDGADVIGYALTAKCHYLGHEPFVEVVQLLTAEKNRSTGVGRALMERVEEEARRDGIDVVKLSTQVHRSRAQVFYEGLGYEYYKISKFYQKRLR